MLNTSHVATIWNFDPIYNLPNVTQVSLPKNVPNSSHVVSSTARKSTYPATVVDFSVVVHGSFLNLTMLNIERTMAKGSIKRNDNDYFIVVSH